MASEIKFYMDEHVSMAVIRGLRRRGVDVLTTQEANLLGAADLAHWELAAREGRVIFSQDEDFLVLHRRNIAHAGIVYAHPQTPIGEIVRGLMLIHDVLSAEEMQGRVEFL
jgi:hypothetical protein